MRAAQKQWMFLVALLLAGCGLVGCARFHPQPIDAHNTATAFESRSFDSMDLKAFLETNAPELTKSWPLPQWGLESLTLAAFYYQPSLEVARAQWAVAQAGVITAGARPNPSLSVTPEYSVNPASGVSPWIATASLDVPIETAGKRGYRVASAEQRARAARLKIISMAWQVRSNVRATLLAFTSAQQREKLLQAQQTMWTEISQRLEQKLAAGALEPLELSRARLALTRARLDADDARRQSLDAQARLAEAVGVPLSALTAIAVQEDWAPSSVVELTANEARKEALLGRPDVLSSLAEYEASQANLQLEIARQYPDVHLGPGYQYDQGENKWSLGLTVDLPVFNRNEGPIAEAHAKRHEAAMQFLAVQSKVMAEVDRATIAVGNAQERLKSLASLRASQQTHAGVLDVQVQAGAAEPLDLLGLQVEQAATGLLDLEARVQHVTALGQLEDAVQLPIADLQPAIFGN